MRRNIRVAAAQCEAGANVDENLATCLRMLDRAARDGADLIVLPEFMNHCSWYEGADHCLAVAVDLDGPFLAAVADRARRHRFHVVVNCTVRRERVVTGTSLLYSPEGHLLVSSDKQVLMGHENEFLTRARSISPVVETAVGRLGLYACMDGVICETPRSLARRGAQILCNSLNSFAPDEASLHVPVRAAENRCFVVAANKVGPLLPRALLGAVSRTTGIPAQFLHGAGESQIVGPDGTVFAKGPLSDEAIVIAEIDPRLADDKTRPDGTDVFAARRRDIYGPLAARPKPIRPSGGVAGELKVAVASSRSVDEAERAIAGTSASVVVLPELFCFEGASVTDVANAEQVSQRAVHRLVQALAGKSTLVATSVVRSGRHAGVLVSQAGVVFEQAQLHSIARHPWSRASSTLATHDIAGAKVAVIVGDDAIFPETMRLAAMRGVEVALVPFHAVERWETEIGLLERSAENRVCVVAATRPSRAGTSLITTLWEDFTLMTPWRTRAFDGNITRPIVTRAGPDDLLTEATIHPANARNKVVSHRTHLLDDRPWDLAQALTL
jgi:predicted amidohydrolase